MMSPLSPVVSKAVLWYLGVGRTTAAPRPTPTTEVPAPTPPSEPVQPPRRLEG